MLDVTGHRKPRQSWCWTDSQKTHNASESVNGLKPKSDSEIKLKLLPFHDVNYKYQQLYGKYSFIDEHLTQGPMTHYNCVSSS